MTVDDRFPRLPREAGEEEPGTRNEIITGPVSDWATDFDHLEPEWSADPYPIQDDLRQRCPVAHTERFGGAWLPTRYEDVARPMRDYVGERGDGLAELVRAAQAHGELDPSLSPGALAHFCLLLAMGSALVTPDLHAVTDEEWAALLTRVIAGLAPATATPVQTGAAQ